MYKCSCDLYRRFDGICGHILAIAKTKEDLRKTIDNYVLHGGNLEALVGNSLPVGGGEKSGKKKPRRGANNVEMTPITRVVRWDDPILDVPKPKNFTEPWHNDSPFFVHLISDKWCKNASECASCGAYFKANKTPEGKIVLIHKEQLIVNGKMQRMFYCCRKKCLHDRHPHFWKGLVKATEAMQEKLTDVHREILYENLNFIV